MPALTLLRAARGPAGRVEEKFNPLQPRDPGGEDGGQWIKVGGLAKKLAREILGTVDAEAVRDVAAVIDGTYAGLSVEVDRADVSGSRLHAFATIRDAGGDQVGHLRRVVALDENGDLYAEHELLQLDEDVQGQGFATEFNAALEDWYRASGVQRVELHADIDVGGFAWARAGWNFRDGHVPTSVRDRLAGLAEPRLAEPRQGGGFRVEVEPQFDEESNMPVYRLELPDGTFYAESSGDPVEFIDIDEARYMAQVVEDELADEADEAADGRLDHQPDPAELAAASDLLARINAGEPVSAYEISQLGREPGQSGHDATWLGKQVMLGSNWFGVKWLT